MSQCQNSKLPITVSLKHAFVVNEVSALPLVPWQFFFVDRVAKHQDPQLYTSPVFEPFSLSKPFKVLILRIRAQAMVSLSGPGTRQTSHFFVVAVKGRCLCFKKGTWWPSGRRLHNATRMATDCHSNVLFTSMATI